MSPGTRLRERIAAGDPVSVVAFRLGGEVCAVDILAVEEVVSPERLHPIPDAPRRLLGILALRGEMVPVLDVAAALDLGDDPARGCDVLILDYAGHRVGVATDGVRGTRTLAGGALRPPPSGEGRTERFLIGVASLEEALVSLIDPDEIIAELDTLSPEESA